MLSRWYPRSVPLSVLLAGAVFLAPCQAAGPQAAPVAITVHPSAIELRHPRQPHSLQVLGTTADGYSLDLRSEARFTSANPGIAVVDTQG